MGSLLKEAFALQEVQINFLYWSVFAVDTLRSVCYEYREQLFGTRNGVVNRGCLLLLEASV